HQVLTNAIYIFSDYGIVDKPAGGFNLLGVFPAHPDLPFDGVPVSEPAAAANIPVSNCAQVARAAVVIALDQVLVGIFGGCEGKQEEGHDPRRDKALHGSPR